MHITIPRTVAALALCVFMLGASVATIGATSLYTAATDEAYQAGLHEGMSHTCSCHAIAAR